MILASALRGQRRCAPFDNAAVVDKIAKLLIRRHGDALEHAGFARCSRADEGPATAAASRLEQTSLSKDHQGATEGDGGDSERLGQADFGRQLISRSKKTDGYCLSEAGNRFGDRASLADRRVDTLIDEPV